jgi:hypothetical protein
MIMTEALKRVREKEDARRVKIKKRAEIRKAAKLLNNTNISDAPRVTKKQARPLKHTEKLRRRTREQVERRAVKLAQRADLLQLTQMMSNTNFSDEPRVPELKTKRSRPNQRKKLAAEQKMEVDVQQVSKENE